MASRRQRCSAYQGNTIDGALRLAAKRHESAESMNLTWTVYYVVTFYVFDTQNDLTIN